jgi:hypothetical protein
VFSAPILHGTGQRLEVVGGHDSRAVEGSATIVALSWRSRITARLAISFIVDEVTIVRMFSQNGFQTIKIGTSVDIVSTTFT